jgi:Phage integrase family
LSAWSLKKLGWLQSDCECLQQGELAGPTVQIGVDSARCLAGVQRSESDGHFRIDDPGVNKRDQKDVLTVGEVLLPGLGDDSKCTAMHLLQSGISLDMIRDFLGHVDVKTTQIYARANLEMKRNALEKISEPSSIQAIPCWQQNKDLLNWLRSL